MFDVTKAGYVDALVVPNLLCASYLIKKTTNHTPIMRIVNNDEYVFSNERKKISRYLHEIGFVKLASTHRLFRIEDFSKEPEHRLIPDYCTTFYFEGFPMNDNYELSAQEIEEQKFEIARRISEKSHVIFNDHLKQHFVYDEYFGSVNIFARFAAKLCHNSSYHGHSFSYMTIQTNVAKNMAYIAVSDCGVGFLESLRKKQKTVS